MKLKALLFVSCLSLLSSAYAADRILPTYADGSKSVAKSIDSKLRNPGYCEIEVINDSDWDVIVSGRVTNGGVFNPFIVRAFGPSKIMDLYDYRYGECPEGVYVYIKNAETGYQFHSDFHYPGEIIRIFNRNSEIQALTMKK